MSTYRTEDPRSGKIVKTWRPMSDAEVQAAITTADAAFQQWRTTSSQERAEVLRRAAGLFLERAEELADIAATEMGKPVEQGVGEVKLSAEILNFYADQADDLLAVDTLPPLEAVENLVEKEPLGVLLGVMPWNFPYYQLVRFLAPNLLLGNTILLKPAAICTASALTVDEILAEAGLPNDAYQTVLVSNDQIQDIIADSRIRGVSLTGSEAAGQAVAEAAGRHLKKSVLELGGSDAMIVLGGDIPAVAAEAAQARLSNAGQACNSPKRMIVLDEHHDLFLEELVSAFEAAVVGDPHEAGTDVGPMSSPQALQDLMELVDDAVEHGAQVHTGGAPVDGEGNYMKPTVLTGVDDSMRAFKEELFGPVAVVHRASSVDEAVTIANSTDFGLSGSVWGDDTDLAARTARRLEVGMAYVNEHGTTKAGLPFGGVRRSGYGRELGPYGVDEFVNKKLVRTNVPTQTKEQ